MTRSVTDCAVLLNILVGQDERDEYTLKQPPGTSSIDYTRSLKNDALSGARIGVPRAFLCEVKDDIKIATFNEAIETIKALGADVVDPANFENWEILLTKGVELEETYPMTVDYKVYLVILSQFVCHSNSK
jgi:amidase